MKIVTDISTLNGGRRAQRGFTMVEIALSLAVIAFALVAIIGVLPAGLSVQKDNREQTIINLDAAFLMDAIRNGARGQDDLTNYIVAIYKTNLTVVTAGAWPTRGGGGFPPGYVNFSTQTYTRTTTTVGGATTAQSLLTNGANIVGLLSLPKYTPYVYPAPPANPAVQGYDSNGVTAVFRAINAPAVDQGLGATSRDFAFQYQVTVEIVPSAASPFAFNTLSTPNLTAPPFTTATTTAQAGQTAAMFLQDNLYEIRMTFRWPILGTNTTTGAVRVGGGRAVYRSSVAGSYAYFNGGNMIAPWYLQPQTYTPVQLP